jgi:TPR repeat protein
MTHTLSDEDKQKIAAIQIKAADLRDKAAKQFPYEGTIPRIKGRGYRPVWMVLRDWILYIGAHSLFVIIPFVLALGFSLIVLLVDSFFWQIVLAAPILVGGWALYRSSRRRPTLREQLDEVVAGPDQGANELAVPTLRALAEKGYSPAQLLLGQLYARGRGVVKSERGAVRWYRAAAERGLAQAQYCLGTLYADGRGVTRDLEEAINWYEKAAAQGLPQAGDSLSYLRDTERLDDEG